jgi:hypothetical protein
MIYGNLPKDCGLVDLHPTEMMFWLYCPIFTPRQWLTFPDNLVQFRPLVKAALNEEYDLEDHYGYLTVKTMYVAADHNLNRPGWHSDGFGTDDINYIWSDRAPTEFYADSFELPPECPDAMRIMTQRAYGKEIVTYPDRHLLRLDQSVIHRQAVHVEPGMRTFIKLSLSKDRYNLIGNSINWRIDERWPLIERKAERNHPAS